MKQNDAQVEMCFRQKGNAGRRDRDKNSQQHFGEDVASDCAADREQE